MNRIDGAGHIGNMFVAEDSAISRPPTEITDDWLNGVQEELIAVITGADLIPAAGDNTQLRQAIAKMIQSGQRTVVIDGVNFAPAVTLTGKAVYWDAANNRFDLAVADGTAKQNCLGFADVPNGNVYAFGKAVLFAGLTPGARYYLDAATPGLVTSVAPANAVFVGIARSAAELFVDIDPVASGPSKQIQRIDASVAGNALTLTLNPTSLDFRSSALSSGTVNTRTIAAPISLVISSGSSLGTVNGQAARLALLAIDNAGSVELAVVNLAGGIALDETTLISTAAEGGAGSADSATVIYSVAARANVPFRVVGWVDISEAAAGTWVTAPTTIQGAGGLAKMQSTVFQGAAVVTTAGSSIDFSNFPANVKRITINFNQVSTTGTSSELIRLGTAGGIQTATYTGCAYGGQGAGQQELNVWTTGIELQYLPIVASANAISGQVILTLLDPASNIWGVLGSIYRSGSTASHNVITGSVSLPGRLTTVRFTTAGGSDTCDGGAMNVSWE